jgi:hypothetical protein
MPPKPIGKFVFGQFPSGKGEEGNDQLSVCRLQNKTIERQKGFGHHRRSALIAINKGMITGNPKSVSRCKRRYVRFTISCQILCPRHCTIEQPHIAHALPAAMFGKLLEMRRLSDLKCDPDPILRHRLFREFSQRPLALRHHISRNRHLRIEFRFRRADLNPARRLGDRQSPPNHRVEMGQQFLGQDHPRRIADLRDFKLHVHTGIITRPIVKSRMRVKITQRLATRLEQSQRPLPRHVRALGVIILAPI